VRSRQDVYGRNEQLLDYICQTGVETEKFLNALKHTDQQHVVNYILHNGGQFRRASAAYTLRLTAFLLAPRIA